MNPNTVTKAYRDLELIGVLSTRRGVGVMVTNDAAGICGEPIRREAKGRLRDAVAECVASGHSVEDISSIVDGAIDEKHLPYMVSGE